MAWVLAGLIGGAVALDCATDRVNRRLYYLQESLNRLETRGITFATGQADTRTAAGFYYKNKDPEGGENINTDPEGGGNILAAIGIIGIVAACITWHRRRATANSTGEKATANSTGEEAARARPSRGASFLAVGTIAGACILAAMKG